MTLNGGTLQLDADSKVSGPGAYQGVIQNGRAPVTLAQNGATAPATSPYMQRFQNPSAGGTVDRYATNVKPVLDQTKSMASHYANPPGRANFSGTITDGSAPAGASYAGLAAIVNAGEGKLGTVGALLGGTTTPAVQPAGLASLDFELPEGGQVYYFIAPRGQIEITANALSDGFLAKLGYLAAALAGILLLAGLLRVIRRGGMNWLSKPPAAVLMVCLGVLSMVFGVLPMAGAILFLLGVALLIHRAWVRNRAKPAILAATAK